MEVIAAALQLFARFLEAAKVYFELKHSRDNDHSDALDARKNIDRRPKHLRG